MTPKGSFENQYEEYSPNAATNVLNESKDGISTKFLSKLQNFKEDKLKILDTTLKSDIFYDASVYTGSAGFAFYHLMRPSNKEDPLENYLIAFDYVNLDALKGRYLSFMCGDAGPLAIATIISYKIGSRRPAALPDYKALAQRLVSLISLMNDSPDEILYGKAGYLYALLLVNKYTSGKDLIPANHIDKVISSILKSGKQFALHMKSETPLLWQWHDKIYFGAAHGMAGILYMLLQARNYLNVIDLRNYIKPAIDWLTSHRFSSGNFPSSLGSSSGDRLVQWCHGAPGLVPLCLLAYQIFEEDKYLKIALKCGDVVWERGLTAKGYSICHGVSGNAYTFLQLYQITKDAEQLYRACCFMEWSAVERRGTQLQRPDRPASLFEGVVGRLYLLEDMCRPLQAKFPGFTL